MKNTFDLVEQGDIVIGRGEYNADIRIVEDIDKCEHGENVDIGIFKHVLLVNGVEDVAYSSEEIEEFNKEWRLFGKKEDLLYKEKADKKMLLGGLNKQEYAIECYNALYGLLNKLGEFGLDMNDYEIEITTRKVDNNEKSEITIEI